MLTMSWNTFRERWQVFLGAIVTVCLGVALFQSSLVLLVSAATAARPSGLPDAQQRAVDDAYAGLVSLLGIGLGLVTFISIFIVGSTFAFAVAQRRQDLALLRLTGASRRQVRSLLLGEAVLLGAAGSVLGVLAGLPLMRAQTAVLRHLDLVPPGFEVRWHLWVVPASIGLGLVVSCLGVYAASRRAARVEPLEALRDIGRAARVMTVGRWVTGGVFLAGGVAMMSAGSAVGGDGAIALSILVSAVLVTALAALAPIVVPLVGWVLRPVFVGALGQLARANLRDGVRRSASTAAPIMVLIAFVAGFLGVTGTLADTGDRERERLHTAELVVTPDDGAALDPDALRAVPGVEAVSAVRTVLFDVGVDLADGPPILYEAADGSAVDVGDFLLTHRLEAVDGDLARLTGDDTMAVSQSYDTTQHWQVGDVVPIRLHGEDRELRIVALLPDTVVGPYFLFPSELVADQPLPTHFFVDVADGVEVDQVAAAIAGGGDAEVSTVGDWIARTSDEVTQSNSSVATALLGLSAIYTVIAMINAVVISASARRREFAAARLTGLTRRQVVGTALYESLAVLVVGLLLGGIAALGTMVGISTAVRDMTGFRVFSVPWEVLGAMAAGAAIVVAVTTVLTALAATRATPVAELGARD